MLTEKYRNQLGLAPTHTIPKNIKRGNTITRFFKLIKNLIK